jgi:hypothetical protein
MKSGYTKYHRQTARMVLLRHLSQMPGFVSNELIMSEELDALGIRASREWLRTQLMKLEELEAIALHDENATLVAKLTTTGMDHIEGRSRLEGVSAPRPGV